MFKKLIILTLLSSCLFAVSIVSHVDRKKVAMGDVFTLTIEVTGSTESPQVNISSIQKDFTIVNGPFSQTSINSVNGNVRKSLSQTWNITPNRVGSFVIPSFHVRVGNAKYRTNSIKIDVKKDQIQSKNETIFLSINLDKNTAYPGEQITVEYKLYTKTTDLSITNIAPPEYVGFWAEELYKATRLNFRNVYMNGEQYKVTRLFTYALFPTKTGELSIPEMTIKCEVSEKRKSSRRSIFDTFYQPTVTKILRASEKKIRVESFPENEPSNYQGVVGEYLLHAEIDRTSLPANDAVTLDVTLTGTGNISLINTPDIHFPDALEVFPPTISIEKDPFRDQITGTLNWEYILIPRQTGKFTIPRIEIPYFNPMKKTWERAETKPILLSVTPSKTPVNISSGFSKEEVELLGKDIRYFRSAISKWRPIERHVSVSKSILVIYILTVCLVLLPFGLTNFNQSREESIEYRRSKSALKIAQKKLKHPTEDVFTQAADAIYPFLKDRFYLQSEQLDPHLVHSVFVNKIDERELTELIKILNVCDAGRYAPGAASSKDDLIDKTRKLLKRINSYA